MFYSCLLSQAFVWLTLFKTTAYVNIISTYSNKSLGLWGKDTQGFKALHISFRELDDGVVQLTIQSKEMPRGLEVRGEWRVTHTTFTQETWGRVLFESVTSHFPFLVLGLNLTKLTVGILFCVLLANNLLEQCIK